MSFLTLVLLAGCQLVAGFGDPLVEPDAGTLLRDGAVGSDVGAPTDAGADRVEVPDALATPDLLIAGRDFVWDVVADEDAVYFSQDETYRKRFDGGLERLSTAPHSNLALDATHLYFNGGASGNELRRVPRNGTSADVELLDTVPSVIQDVVIDATTVFYNDNEGRIYARAKAAGPRRTVTTGYTSNLGASDKALVAGSAIIDRDSGVANVLLRAAEPSTPFPTRGDVAAYRDNQRKVVRLDLNNGAPTVLGAGVTFPLEPAVGGSGTCGVALDLLNAWVSVSTPTSGSIWQLPLDGGAGAPIATAKDPRLITLTPSRILWVAGDNAGQVGIFQLRR